MAERESRASKSGAKATSKAPAKAGSSAKTAGSTAKAGTSKSSKSVVKAEKTPSSKTVSAKTPKAAVKSADKSAAKPAVPAAKASLQAEEVQQQAPVAPAAVAAPAPEPVVEAPKKEIATFKVGDNAVYPGHGVGRVTAIESKEIFGKKHEFYSIQILENGMKIMIPKDNVESVGLRPIISREQAAKVIEILKETNVKIDNQTWNRRYREYMEKIKTGSVFEIAEVLRDLFLLKVDKELSFGERKMLDTARNLLLKELSLATSREELNSQDEVRAIFGIES